MVGLTNISQKAGLMKPAPATTMVMTTSSVTLSPTWDSLRESFEIAIGRSDFGAFDGKTNLSAANSALKASPVGAPSASQAWINFVVRR